MSSTAISEHQRMTEALRVLQTQNATLAQDNESLRRENHALVLQLRTGSQHPPAAGAPPPPPAGSFSSDPYGHRQELPPLRALNGGPPGGPESMTGVQYEAPRPNGYRPPERY